MKWAKHEAIIMEMLQMTFEMRPISKFFLPPKKKEQAMTIYQWFIVRVIRKILLPTLKIGRE